MDTCKTSEQRLVAARVIIYGFDWKSLENSELETPEAYLLFSEGVEFST